MSNKLATLLHGFVAGELQGEVLGLALDSRKVKPGMLFLAIPGHQVDGRDYVSAAIAAGAVAVVYEARDYSLDEHEVPCYPVSDLGKHIGVIASRFYDEPTKSIKVIGVTGTNGKTTVAMLLTQALTHLGYSTAYLGTLGAVLGTRVSSTGHTTPDPISFQKQLADWVSKGVEYVCVEVSSHALDQGRVDGTQFAGAILTNLTHEHLDYHQTMERYADAKARLFLGLKPGWSVLNLDDEFGQQLANESSIVHKRTYGALADIRAIDVCQRLTGLSFTIVDNEQQLDVVTGLVGAINVPNVLAVYAALIELGFAQTEIIEAIAQLTAVPGRMELFRTRKSPSVVVDYAHTPDALERALMSLRAHCKGLLWCVFGCGGDRDVEKRPMMGAIAERFADEVLITNDNPRSESPESIVHDIRSGMQSTPEVHLDRPAAIALAIERASNKDWVLVAGKGHETKQFIGKHQIEFSDRQFIRELLETA